MRKRGIQHCEDQFIESVSLRIFGCEHVSELLNALTKDNCFNDIAHMSASEQIEFVEELWNEYWLEKGHG